MQQQQQQQRVRQCAARPTDAPPQPLPDLSPAHLVPVAKPRFSWQYIWSFFMRAPRVRAWLFQKQRPSASHVVQSLLSSPMLVGYIFGSFHERSRVYAFPDIGDLQTVFCRDGETILGFHFGFQGVQPVMPLLFQVIKDPMLGNPNVIVRRTARQRAPYPFQNYYLVMEFDWYESGALGIVTNVSPVDSDIDAPSGLCPYVLHAEHRVFSRQTADRLCAATENLAQQVDLAFFPHPSHFVDLPPDFIDLPDDYVFLTVREPDDPVYSAKLQQPYVPPEQKYQTFELEKVIPEANTPTSTTTTANSVSTTTTSNTGSTHNSTANQTGAPNEGGKSDYGIVMPSMPAGAGLHCDRGEVSSVAESGTMELWKHYQRKVAQSRRTGIILTMLGKKAGGRLAKPTPVFGRESRYVFLSTSGINVHGRIQRLCSQLGFKFGSPLPDQVLFTNKDEEAVGDTHFTNEAGELDVSGQRDEQSWQPERLQTQIGQGVGALLAQHPGSTADASGSGIGRIDPPNRLTVPGNTGMLRQGSDGIGSENVQDLRYPKRRRFSSPRSGSPLDQGLPPAQAAVHEIRAPSEPNWGTITKAATSLPPGPGLDEDVSQLQRRSFDLNHILSESKQNGLGAADVPQDAANGAALGASAPRLYREREGGERPGSAGDSSAGGDGGKVKGSKTVWTCDRCGVQIRGKKGNLNRHIANKHENIRAFACSREGCGRKFQTRLNLVRHETAVHDGRPHTCPNCPRSFKYEDDMKAHIKSAHEDPGATLACEICGSCFGRRSTLNRHMAKVHKTKPGAV